MSLHGRALISAHLPSILFCEPGCLSDKRPRRRKKKRKRKHRAIYAAWQFSNGLLERFRVVPEARLLSATSDRGVVTAVQHHLTSSRAHHKTSACCQIQTEKAGRICSFRLCSGDVSVVMQWKMLYLWCQCHQTQQRDFWLIACEWEHLKLLAWMFVWILPKWVFGL